MLKLFILLTISIQTGATDILTAANMFAPSGDLGFYDLLIKRFDKSINLKKEPQKRSFASFVDHKSDCYLGGTASEWMKVYKRLRVIESDLIVRYGLGIYSIKGEKVSSLNELKDKKVIVLRGTNVYVEKIQNDDFHEVSYEPQMFDMLKKGRVDAVIYWFPVANKYKKYLNEVNFKIFTSQERLVCHTSKKNKEYISRFNNFLEKMRETKEIEELFLKYFKKEDLKYLK